MPARTLISPLICVNIINNKANVGAHREGEEGRGDRDGQELRILSQTLLLITLLKDPVLIWKPEPIYLLEGQRTNERNRIEYNRRE